MSKDEDVSEALSKILHRTMEHLDPRGEAWSDLTERDREFYRYCVEALLVSGLVVVAKKERTHR
jgi:hypothetical protein